MARISRQQISKSRRLLENPYAYVEQLETQGPDLVSVSDASLDSIVASRKLLQDPYAHLDGDGGLAGHSKAATAPKSGQPRSAQRTWTDLQIEERVQDIHARLWRERSSIWGGVVPTDPVDLLDPAMALKMFGFDFRLEDGLGQMSGSSGSIEVAGIIDLNSRVVRVGSQFPPSVRTFTAAHEFGHAVLHPMLSGLHRDKPLDGSPMAEDRVEVEANKFATLFLMPANLVKARFQSLFLTETFVLTEETAYALVGKSLSELRRLQPTRRHLSHMIAGANRYNGQQIVPLHQQFRVSRLAMAIRLEELALVP